MEFQEGKTMPTLKLVSGHFYTVRFFDLGRKDFKNDPDNYIRHCICNLKSHKEVGHPFKIQFAFFPSSHITTLVNVLILLTLVLF